MKIELTREQMKSIKKESALIVDNEEWEYVEQDGEEEEDEHGRYYSHIYMRISDRKCFRINLFYIRYGYKDYGFESDSQDCVAYEVEKKEIVKYEWRYVRWLQFALLDIGQTN